MRHAAIDALCRAADSDRRIWLLYGDLGRGVIDPFLERFPDRCVNAGVAEQNMVGVAAGLALSGKRPVVYSITNFAVLRPLEQVRNDVCYPDLPVVFLGVGVGKDYGFLGHTHHGIEDGQVAALLPNMTVLTPDTPDAARQAVERALRDGHPHYIRLRRA